MSQHKWQFIQANKHGHLTSPQNHTIGKWPFGEVISDRYFSFSTCVCIYPNVWTKANSDWIRIHKKKNEIGKLQLNHDHWSWCYHTFMAEFGVQWKNPNLSQSQVKFGQITVQAPFHIRSKMIWKTQWQWILIRSTSISICEHNAFLSHVPDLVLRLLFPLVYVSYVSWDVHPEILASTSNWSFEEKTFVKQSLGTVLEILTKLLHFQGGKA